MKKYYFSVASVFKNEINQLEWNCYQDYSPEKVVQKFEEVYLK